MPDSVDELHLGDEIVSRIVSVVDAGNGTNRASQSIFFQGGDVFRGSRRRRFYSIKRRTDTDSVLAEAADDDVLSKPLTTNTQPRNMARLYGSPMTSRVGWAFWVNQPSPEVGSTQPQQP